MNGGKAYVMYESVHKCRTFTVPLSFRYMAFCDPNIPTNDGFPVCVSCYVHSNIQT